MVMMLMMMFIKFSKGNKTQEDAIQPDTLVHIEIMMRAHTRKVKSQAGLVRAGEGTKAAHGGSTALITSSLLRGGSRCSSVYCYD